MWFRKHAKSMQNAMQTAPKPKYPEVGDVFRGVSFGMSEKEFEDCMRKDAVVNVDSTSHAWTSYSTTMFGHKFSKKYWMKSVLMYGRHSKTPSK